MKKLLLITLMFAAVTGCKKVCYNCIDATGQGRGEKCFKSEHEKEEYRAAQYNIAAPQNQCR